MPKFAAMLRYEVISGLIIEAESAEEADRIASEFEEQLHDAASDAEGITVEARIWGNGTVEIEEAEDEEAAADLLDDWLDDIDFDEDDEDEDFDEDDEDEDEDDEDESK